MPTLYDRKGNAVDVPDEQVSQAIASGQYAYGKGEVVTMKGPYGEVMEGPAEEVAEMLRRGFSVESAQEAQQREMQEKYGGTLGKIATTAHGAAKSLSFGLVDQAGKAIGGKEYTETVKNLQRTNPDEELIGEIGGIASAFLIPGGQGKALAGLSKLGKGVRTVGKLGRKVEDVTLKALGGAKGGLVRQALAKGTSLGTGAAIEGALYQTGDLISEEALGETEWTAENLLASMKMGAMWGGMAGVGFGSGGEIIRRGLGSGATFAKRSSKSIRKMYEKARGVKAAEGFEDAIRKEIDEPGIWTKTVATYEGNDPAAVAGLVGKSAQAKVNRQIATSGPKVRQEAAYKMAEIRNAKGELQDDIIEQATGKMKDEYFESAVKANNKVEAGVAVKESLENYKAAIAEMKGNPGAYRFPAQIKELGRVVDDVERRVDAALISKDPRAAGTLFNEADRLKQITGNLRKQMDRVRMPHDLHYATMDRFSSLYVDDLMGKLEDPRLWGEVGAAAQRETNAVWASLLQRGKFKRNYRLDRMVGEKDFGKTMAKRGSKVFKADPGQHRRLIDDLGTERAALDIDQIRFDTTERQRLVETIKKHYKLEGELAEKVGKASKLSDDYLKMLDEMENVVGLQNQLSDITTNASKMGGVLGMGGYGAAGLIAGGPFGALAGVAFSAFTNSGRRISLRAALERMSSSIDIGIAKSIKGYIKKATGKVKPVGRGMLAPASLKILGDSNWGEKKTKDKTRHDAFRRRSRELTEFLSNPQKTMDRIKKNTGDVAEVAPNVATAMMVKSVQSARYLYDRMPKSLSRDTLLTGKFKPSDLDLAKFERIAAVIHNPDNALKSLRAGMLTVEEVDALRANYPKMYERIVVTLAEQIPELRESLPYKEQVQLSILFDVPITATMEPEFLVAMYSLAQMQPMAPGQAPGPRQQKSKLGSYSDLSVDTASMSDTQRVEANKLT